MNNRLIEAHKQLEGSLELLKMILGPALLGVYLYGSSLVGGLQRYSVMYYYPIPERYVNRSDSPNVFPDFEKQADIALRNIRKGEELSIPATFVGDY